MQIIKLKKKEIAFYVAFIVWIVYQLLEVNVYFNKVFLNYPVYRIVYIVTYISLIVSIIQNRVTVMTAKRYLLYFIALIGGLTAVYISEDIIFLLTLILFILAARRLDFNKIVKIDLKLQIIFMIFTVGLALLGITDNGYRYRGDIVRYFLGYKSTLAPMFLFHTTMMFVFLKREKLKWKHVVLILAVNQFFYISSNVRGPYTYTIILILFAKLGKHIKLPRQKIITNIVTLIPLILCFVSIGIHIIYDPSNPVLVSLDSLFSSRLRLGHDAIEQFGFSLLGNNIDWNFVGVSGVDYLYVDSAYLKYTLMYGILFMGLIVLGHAILMRRAWQNNDFYLFIVLFAVAVNSIADPQILYLQYNPFILLLGTFFVNGQKQALLPKYKRRKFKRITSISQTTGD